MLDSVSIGSDAWLELDGGPGNDHLIRTDGWDHFMHGGPDDDWIEGFGDADRLYGEAGDDTSTAATAMSARPASGRWDAGDVYG